MFFNNWEEVKVLLGKPFELPWRELLRFGWGAEREGLIVGK